MRVATARSEAEGPAATVRSQIVSAKAAVVDSAVIAVITVISLVLYAGRLGFYLDDYKYLRMMATSDDRSLFGLYAAARPRTGPRQLQALTLAALYRVFGLHPLGYHIFNACALVLVAVLLYLVLRELRLPRLACVAVALVYSTLPHYATDRFWIAAFQANLSTAFYLLSFYAGLRAVRASRRVLPVWLAIMALGVVGSLLSYEIVFPLFALNVGVIWWAGRRLAGAEVSRRELRFTIGTLVAAIVAVSVAKSALVALQGQGGYQLGLHSSFLSHAFYLVSGSVRLSLGTYFLAFPYVLWWIVQHRFSGANAAVAVLSGLLVGGYLWRIGRRDRQAFPTNGTARALVGSGLLAFVLGYAVFLTNDYILFRSAGIDNRVNAAAALGVASVIVGAISLLVHRMSPRLRLIAFSSLIACTVASGVFVINTLASFWTSASQRQHAIVSGLTREAGRFRSPTTFILDGSCPEIGPAVVFADDGDLRSALDLASGDFSLRADVASEAMRASPKGLSIRMTFLHHVFWRTYAYGRHLLVYDATTGRLHRMTDRSQAANYLARSRPAFQCAPQRSFAWGFDPSSRWSLP